MASTTAFDYADQDFRTIVECLETLKAELELERTMRIDPLFSESVRKEAERLEVMKRDAAGKPDDRLFGD